MPVTFTIDTEARAITTIARGIVSCAELLEHIHARKAAKVMTYAELFDARDVTLDLAIADLHQLAAATREAMGAQQPGRVAVVTNNSFIYGLARTYAALTARENPQFEVFHDLDKARAWISGAKASDPGGRLPC